MKVRDGRGIGVRRGSDSEIQIVVVKGEKRVGIKT